MSPTALDDSDARFAREVLYLDYATPIDDVERLIAYRAIVNFWPADTDDERDPPDTRAHRRCTNARAARIALAVGFFDPATPLQTPLEIGEAFAFVRLIGWHQILKFVPYGGGFRRFINLCGHLQIRYFPEVLEHAQRTGIPPDASVTETFMAIHLKARKIAVDWVHEAVAHPDSLRLSSPSAWNLF